MIFKETWKIGAELNNMEKLTKTTFIYNIIKSVFLKKKNISQVTVKQSTVFFLWMITLETHPVW